MSALTGSPIKLKNGDWGVKTQGVADVDMPVVVKTKSGKTWTAVIDKVVWVGNGVAICATRKLNCGYTSARRQSAPTRRGKWCDCGACDDMLSMGYRPGQRIKCPECGGIAEAC